MSSFTRSISQRLTRRRRRGNTENAPVAPPPAQDALTLASSTTVVPQNKPGLLTRGMDRIRKSLRIPSRRGAELVRSEAGGASSGTGGPDAWHPDEGAVRAGLCSFQVKYLGSVEVFESRGMQVCEGALKMLRAQTKTPIKAVLHVSGDGLRLVDQQNHRGLIVDQTIEKVSFCAPDRSNSRGFAYICREGSSRRWMCHGFQAMHESGERLSHAVGCAFAVCLERKKKRDAENTVTAEKALNPDWEKMGGGAEVAVDGGVDNSLHRTNAAYQSFRRSMPIAERVRDPQGAIVPVPPNGSLADSSKLPPSSIAKPRPSSNPALFERQGSLRAPAIDAANQQFKRQFSLRNYEKPYASPSSVVGETISEGDESGVGSLLLPELANLMPATSPAASPHPGVQQLQQQPIYQNAPIHSTYTPPPTVAWGAPVPAVNGGAAQQQQPAPGSIYQNPPNAVSTGFTPQNEISVNTMWSSPPSSSRSKADEWLASTLQQSLSMTGSGPGTPLGPMSPRMTTSSSSGDASMSAPPPSHPPPPLPPAAILASPDRPVGDRLFDQRQEENIAPAQWGGANGVQPVQQLQQSGKPVFPTVFSPETPFPPSGFPPSAARSQPAQQAPAVDPFDVQWSRLALSSNGGNV